MPATAPPRRPYSTASATTLPASPRRPSSSSRASTARHPDVHGDLHQASPPTTARLHRTQATIVLHHDHHDVCTATVPDLQPIAEATSLPSDGTPVSNILAKAPIFPFPIVALA